MPRRNHGKKYKHLNPITPEGAVNPLSAPPRVEVALHVVSVPIGNVKDFSVRALEVLQQCDYIICTQRNATKALLDIIDVSSAGRLVQYQPDYRREDGGLSVRKLIELVRGGRSVALVVPAGTPAVGGDGGAELVREMRQAGVRVTAVPGACAITAALAIAGAETPERPESIQDEGSSPNAALSALAAAQAPAPGAYYFGGYLSERGGQRVRQLRAIRDLRCPAIFFEVPKRLVASLIDIDLILDSEQHQLAANKAAPCTMAPAASGHLGPAAEAQRTKRLPRRVTVLHELTKYHESVHTGTASALRQHYAAAAATKTTELGQLVIVIDGVRAADARREILAQLAAEAYAPQSSSDGGMQQSYFNSAVFGRKPDNHDNGNNSNNNSINSNNDSSIESDARAKKRRLVKIARAKRRSMARARLHALGLVEYERRRRELHQYTEGTHPLPE